MAQTKEYNVNIGLFTSMSLIHYTLNPQEKLHHHLHHHHHHQKQQQQQNYEKQIKVKSEY